MNNKKYSLEDGELYEEPILIKEEREYLSNVIKPYKAEEIDYIMKMCSCTFINKEFIAICFTNPDVTALGCKLLPYLENNTMFAGMEVDKKYSLEELRL